MHIKSRAQALRELSKYSTRYKTADYEPIGIEVRPKGWSVVLAEMSSEHHSAQIRRDMQGFYKAIAFLANHAAPPPVRKRKRKAKGRR
jgi:hypothetical protein